MTNQIYPCDDWEEFLAVPSEFLTRPVRLALDRHLASCPVCALVRDQYQALDEAIHHWPALKAPLDFPPQLRLLWKKQAPDERSAIPALVHLNSERTHHQGYKVTTPEETPDFRSSPVSAQHQQTLWMDQGAPVDQEEGNMESVLLVDPTPAVHEQVEQMSQGLFVLRHARSAGEALEAIGRQRPDVIISEVDLPDRSGLELCEWVRGNPATNGIPILLLTSRAEINSKVAGFIAGADDYVVKPIDPRFFSARIRLLFRLKDKERKLPSSHGSPPHPPGSSLPRPERFNVHALERSADENVTRPSRSGELLVGLGRSIGYQTEKVGEALKAARILVVNDEELVLRSLRRMLIANGYEVQVAASGTEGLDLARQKLPDLILVNVSMPGMDGLAICRELRQWSTAPIIVVSARGEERFKVHALDLGADDYLTQPFGAEELLARIQTCLRRSAGSQKDEAPDDEHILTSEDGYLSMNVDSRTVMAGTRQVRLTPKEFDLLHQLMASPDRVLTHRALLRAIWGPEYGDETDYLRVFVRQLRRKIEQDPTHPCYILAEPGVGYIFRSR